jgi:hypothetical protein
MTENNEEQIQVAGQKIESDTLRCDIRFYAAANQFIEQQITEIPELQAVTVIPLWAPALADAPNGMLRLRDEQTPYLPNLMHAIMRLFAFSVDIHKDMVVQLRRYDMAAKAKADELQQLDAQLNQKRTEAEKA